MAYSLLVVFIYAVVFWVFIVRPVVSLITGTAIMTFHSKRDFFGGAPTVSTETFTGWTERGISIGFLAVGLWVFGGLCRDELRRRRRLRSSSGSSEP